VNEQSAVELSYAIQTSRVKCVKTEGLMRSLFCALFV